METYNAPEGFRVHFTVRETEDGLSTRELIDASALCETCADVAALRRTIDNQLDKIGELLAGEDEPDDEGGAPETQPEAYKQVASWRSALRAPTTRRGLMKLVCPECHAVFVVCNRDGLPAVGCRCGHWVKTKAADVDPFELTCRRCGKHIYGSTNIRRVYPAQQSMTFSCMCGQVNTLNWTDEAGGFKGEST